MAALHDIAADSLEQMACYCCGTPVEAVSIVRFHRHPHNGVCISCAAWLHKRSLSIAHKTRPPFWWRLTPSRFHRD